MNILKMLFGSNEPQHTNALTGESFTPPTKEGKRFFTFFMVKVESEKELQEFISICKAHDIMLHMAISSPTFWDTLLRGELYGKVIYPVYFIIEKDKWEIRNGYAGYIRNLDYDQKIHRYNPKIVYDKLGGSMGAFRKVIQTLKP